MYWMLVVNVHAESIVMEQLKVWYSFDLSFDSGH